MFYFFLLFLFFVLGITKEHNFNLELERKFPGLKVEKVSKYKPQVKIVNGIPTTVSKFPWMASIKYVGVQYSSNGETNWVLSHFCGGSLIQLSDPPIVLTAAHCLDGQQAEINAITNEFEEYYGDKFVFNLAVDIGRTNVSDETNEIYATVEVANWYIHQDYNKNEDLENDIAIMYLEGNIDMTIVPNTTTVTWDVDTTLVQDDFLRVIGYGTNSSGGELTPTLEYTDLKYIEEEECNDYQNLFVYLNATGVSWKSYDWSNPDFTVLDGWNGYYDYIQPGMICGWSVDSDSCQGDSGGPLLNGPDKSDTQVGVVSWGIGCAFGVPGIYSSVNYFRDWLSGAIDCVMCDYGDDSCIDCKSWKKNYGKPWDRYSSESNESYDIAKAIGIAIGIISICLCIGICVLYRHKLCSGGSSHGQTELTRI